MGRDDGGYWLPIHSGLLRDERWSCLTPIQRGAWITLFLLLDGEPKVGWFRDKARVEWLLTREGWTTKQARALIQAFDDADWWTPAEEDRSNAVTLRGWHEYTGQKSRKAIYNQTRGDRGDRSAEYARRERGRRRETTGDSGRPRRDETRQDEKTPRPPAKAAGSGVSKAEAAKVMGSLRERIKQINGKYISVDPHVLTDETD